MELLRNLELLAKEVVQNYNENFDPCDCKIPQAFKNRVKTLNTFSIVYNDYSAIIKGDGVRSKDSYVPNQTFYMATFFIDYSYELYKYKQKILPWLQNEGITTNQLQEFFTHERDFGKKDISENNDKFVKILDSIGYNEPDRDNIIRFVTDYAWWSGNKTIDRNDFFNSPVLNIMGLTAASNAAMALIVQYLTLHPDDYSLLMNELNNNIIMKNLVGYNKIYFGSPGSGKSWKVNNEVLPSNEKLIFRTTFHPDTDYSSFVGCYKPQMKDQKIEYKFSPQVFTDAYIAAWNGLEKQEKYYLVIEEINRGNCAQIFGDLFQLLDRKKENGLSEYPIKADNDLRDYLEHAKTEEGEQVLKNKDGIKNGKLCLPPNLNIIATMNTSDQSLFPMDSAFKRRWSWEYVPINYNEPKSAAFKLSIDGLKDGKWIVFLEKINKIILEKTDSEDKQMGNFFIKGDVDEQEFKDKVMFYLWSEVCKDSFHTNDNFFRTKTRQFSYNELYGSEGHDLLLGFFEYIKDYNLKDDQKE